MLLVTGGTGYTGRRALQRLRSLGQPLRFLVRPDSDAEGLTRPGDELVRGDLECPEDVARACDGVDRVLHLAHIRFAGALAAAAGDGLRHAVLVSSTWRHSRVPSPAVDEVIAGEAAAAASSLPWTVLRPTMIYGSGNDRNISRLADQVRRHGWVPVFGSGEQLHQPVFVEDVVDACVSCLSLPRPAVRAYDLGGAAPLSYNQLVDAVGRAVGRKARRVHVPVRPAAAALSLAERLGLHLPVTVEQVRRSQESRACDIATARADLGYDPVTFEQGLARVYGAVEDSGD